MRVRPRKRDCVGETPLLPLHRAALRSALVIVPFEMEETVDEQTVELALQRRIVLRRLPARGLDRDDDVPEQTLPFGRFDLVLEREAEHVRRGIAAAILTVEAANRRVVDERERKARPLLADRAEEPARGRHERAAVHAAAPHVVAIVDHARLGAVFAYAATMRATSG